MEDNRRRPGLAERRALDIGDPRRGNYRGELPALVIDVEFTEVRKISWMVKVIQEFGLELLEGFAVGMFTVLCLSLIVTVIALT
jgi:hypothetical protein